MTGIAQSRRETNKAQDEGKSGEGTKAERRRK